MDKIPIPKGDSYDLLFALLFNFIWTLSAVYQYKYSYITFSLTTALTYLFHLKYF